MANDGCPSCGKHGHTIQPVSRLAKCDNCPAIFNVDTREVVAEFVPEGVSVPVPAKAAKKATRKPAKKKPAKKAAKKASAS